jgi:hypothetical protein
MRGAPLLPIPFAVMPGLIPSIDAVERLADTRTCASGAAISFAAIGPRPDVGGRDKSGHDAPRMVDQEVHA